MTGVRVLGDLSKLFKQHSDKVDYEKALLAIDFAVELSVINIDEINNVSDLGGLYVGKDGTIFDGFGFSEDSKAYYKIVPTGLVTKFNNIPILASFYKDDNEWKGVYIGTIDKLFRMYQKFYRGDHDFSGQYNEFFAGDDGCKDIRGFGLTSVLDHFKNGDSEIVYSSTESDNVESQAIVAQDKLSRLKSSLEKTEALLNKKLSKSQRRKTEIKIENLKKEIERDEKESSQNIENTDEVSEVKQAEEVSAIKEEVVAEEPKKRGRKKAAKASEETAAGSKESDTEKEVSVESSDSTGEEDVDTTKKTSRGRKMATDNTVEEEKPAVKKRTHKTLKAEDVTVIVSEMLQQFKEENIQQVKNCEAVAVSTEETIVDAATIETELAEISVTLTEEEAKTVSEVCNDIYNRLMFKENWMKGNGNRIATYLKSIITYVSHKVSKSASGSPERESGDGYVMSSNKRKRLINTNLIDVYGNNIYIIDHSPYNNNFYKKMITVMTSKSALVDEGFSTTTVRRLPGPVIFGKKTDFIFEATIDDFDLEDEEHLSHIINDRRCRFPAKYKNESVSAISAKLKSSIEQALMISQMDYRYILPMYNLVQDEIEFLIPFHLDTHYGEKPELAIIASKKKSFWKIFTIVQSDIAYENARLICNPVCTWAD
jgi:hypothetical protein